ncbi:hypothetical protein BBJ28_00005745 [Nothophytophthora sp. Chile5]|nr:hypothetical protein BBJ28_00005745 [Nothophytophthora sp. Chile5]
MPSVVELLAGLSLLAATIGWLGISRSGKKRPSLKRYEHTRLFCSSTATFADSSRSETASETFVKLAPASNEEEPRHTQTPVGSRDMTDGSRADAPTPTTPVEAILQFVLDALNHFTGLPLLMVNPTDDRFPRLPRALTTEAVETEQMRAEKKNAALLDTPTGSKSGFPPRAASWDDHEAPEEELSDDSASSSDSDEDSDSEEEEAAAVAAVPVSSPAQSKLFDGLQFYLAVSQVRERAVQSVMTLGVAKAMATLRERKQRESISVIEQRYPDFTCLPTARSTSVRQLPGAQQPQLDLLAALRLPSAAAMARNSPYTKRPEELAMDCKASEGDDERVRRATALASPASDASFLQAA